jgi:hypothetical protein
LTDFQKTLAFMTQYVHIWEKWIREPGVLVTRYEDLLFNYEAEASRLVQFLRLDAGRAQVQAVLDAYRPDTAAQGQPGLHFNKGRVGRFREGWTPDQQAVLRERFGSALARMGYEL